ncbi:MAG: acylphosphatase [Desulfococcaceae bacterium]
MSEKPMARAHVSIRGKVQGVFFRAETQRAAEERGVNGWVRNRPDGSVEAVFEGTEKAVFSMVEWCKGGSPQAVVEDVSVDWSDYKGEFDGFEITH